MALDIHIGKKSDKAEFILEFPEKIHQHIFSRYEWVKRYARFGRMEDYYSDVFYTGSELHLLREDLVQVLRRVDSETLREFIGNFIAVCDIAIADNVNIYCFCD